MRLFDKRTPLQKEWEKLEVQEQRFLQKRSEKRESILNQKLEEKIPPKLQKTLDTAFAKAFALIFEKGTGVIEKTYQRTKLEQDYQVRQYMADVKQNSKSLRSFSKKARDTGTKNLLLSGVSGIGMGVLGIGLPDIPVFTGMILKNIYETALQYGYSYESREEKYFILLLIRGAVSYGDTLCEIDGKVNEFIRNGILPEEYQDKEQIEQTAGALSKELLYMKFLQGIPVVGAVGGAYDAVYMKRITEYAELKYRHRYLAGRKKAENGQLCKRCKSYRDGNFLKAIVERQEKLNLNLDITGVELCLDEAKKAMRYGTNVECQDFFAFYRDKVTGKSNYDAIVGNPPFIRYQDFDEKSRDIAFFYMKENGFHPTKLTNIWLPFLILSCLALSENGRLGMVIPAELFQVNYAGETREFLARYFDRLTLITFQKLVFEEIQQEVILLLGEKKSEDKGIQVIELSDLDDLKELDLNNFYNYEIKELNHSTEKWIKYYLTNKEIKLIRQLRECEKIPFTTELFEINVGLVSGENAFFLLNRNTVDEYQLANSTRKGHSYHADTPEDLFYRMHLTMELGENLTEELGRKIAIFSFPMRYIPLVEAGVIKLSIPDKPKSPKQLYYSGEREK